MCKRTFKKGVKIDTQDTPLMLAVQKNPLEIVNILLKDPRTTKELKNKRGLTAKDISTKKLQTTQVELATLKSNRSTKMSQLIPIQLIQKQLIQKQEEAIEKLEKKIDQMKIINELFEEGMSTSSEFPIFS